MTDQRASSFVSVERTHPSYDVVIPTVGRPSLDATLEGLLAGDGPMPCEIVVVDDSSARRGPAAARHSAENLDRARHVGERLGTFRLLLRAVEDQVDVVPSRGQHSNDGIEVPQVPRVVHHEEEAATHLSGPTRASSRSDR